MSLASRLRRRSFWSDKPVSGRLRLYRPIVECLEDRCLLSTGYAPVNLASNVPGLARVTDPNLVNPWGVAFSPTGPFWFAENQTGVSDLLDGRGQPLPLTVTVPPTSQPQGTPTGTVFNDGPGFAVSENGVTAPSRFLFATEDGTISGWSAVIDTTRALLAVDNSSAGAVYKGLALAAGPTGESFLYAADFGRDGIDVFDQNFKPVAHPGAFRDPSLSEGFAPFNIQNINNLLFVTYARQDGAKHDDVPGLSNGFIDVYDTAGKLMRRFASQGPLNSPWGLALAPASFGPFGGALLVGNAGDGHINAYDLGSGAFLGPLADGDGLPITLPTLWSLTFGNDHEGGASDTLFFTAGVDYEQHGLFGAIQAPGRQGADTAGSGTFDPNAPGEPGDYPLPPRSGPALRASEEDRPIPISDLLPLKEPSLLLVPTLSTTSQPITRIEAPVPSLPIAGISLSASVLAAAAAPNAVILLSAGGDSQPATSAQDDALPLYTFLDLNASQDTPQNGGGPQRPDSDLPVVEARNFSLANGDAGAAEVLEELCSERYEAPPSEDQGSVASGRWGQTYEVLAEIPSTNCQESAGERRSGGQRLQTMGGAPWTKLTTLLLVVSLPVLWAYWPRYGSKTWFAPHPSPR